MGESRKGKKEVEKISEYILYKTGRDKLTIVLTFTGDCGERQIRLEMLKTLTKNSCTGIFTTWSV
jgi:hypothetical protein